MVLLSFFFIFFYFFFFVCWCWGGSFDSSAAVTALGGIATAVAAIGAAKLAPAAISVGWKWLKGAIFG
ncbi:major capsid protein [Xylella fastidiosa subsp. multiplex]|uniref:major capsid protein n=1 Tax=Xylella fastidiosa TaxID=2371 RepID=UPI0035D44499